MRPHGRAQINARAPRALGICQRCGFMYNLDALQWQWDWQQGPRLKDLRLKVCRTCLDTPQESGRTIVLPPDPVPVAFALPEDYVGADNPVSYLGYNVTRNFLPHTPQSLSGNIGNMINNAGVDAAFNGNVNKRAEYCAALAVSNSSFNTVGKNWNAFPSGVAITLPSTVAAVTHVLASYVLTAPNDAKFLNSATGITNYFVQGSADNASWTSLSSGATVGAVAEVISGTVTSGGFFQYHRAAIVGDGISRVAIAQAVFNIADAATNDI